MLDPKSLLSGLGGAIYCADAIEAIDHIGDEGRAVILNSLQPVCNHPMCHQAFLSITRMVNLCHKVNKSAEFQSIIKDLAKFRAQIKVMEDLHRQRN